MTGAVDTAKIAALIDEGLVLAAGLQGTLTRELRAARATHAAVRELGDARLADSFSRLAELPGATRAPA